MSKDNKKYFLGIPTGDTIFNSDHLTIKYFGELHPNQIDAIKAKMDAINVEAFPLRSEGLGILGRHQASLVNYIKPVDRLKQLFDEWGADDAIPHITLTEAKPMVSGGIDTPPDQLAEKVILYRIDGKRNYSPIHVKELKRRDPLTYFSDILNLTKEASVVDPPSPHLTPYVWEEDETLRPQVREQILESVYSLFPPERIKAINILGSLTGYKYSADSDLDVNVAIKDLPSEKSRTHYTRNTINGEFIKGSSHPINYFLQNWEEGYQENFKGLDFGVYDVLNNKWLSSTNKSEKEPFKFRHLQDIEWAKMLAQEYFRLKELENRGTPFQRDEARSAILDLIQGVDKARKDAYSTGLGVPRYSEGNMVFKMFEDRLLDSKEFKDLLAASAERLHKRLTINNK